MDGGPMTEREKLVYNAKLAEQGERYDEMSEIMKNVARRKEELTVEERNLLSVAYKNAVGSRRASWRIVSSVEQKEKLKEATEREQMAREYRLKIEEELKKICDDMLGLLTDFLIPNTQRPESKVFYYKMQGDYYRYISELLHTCKHETHDKAESAYELATSMAAADLPSTHPIRLGLALNYSVFHYEIKNDPEKACDMAQGAFNEAITTLDLVTDDTYKDSTLIMQLLRDNLTLWTADRVDTQQVEEPTS